MTALPIPSVESEALSRQLCTLIQRKITEAGGWISFAEFMQLALYAPGLGYYSGGAQKFGEAGDFVTAPEISPIFAQSLARQAQQILQATQGNLLELGAGTGKLAADLLLALEGLAQLPNQYFILEVSDYLRHIQQETLKKRLPENLYRRVVWLKTLPVNFSGLVLGNEVLDAIPVHLITKKNEVLYERGVAFDTNFEWQDVPLKDAVLENQAKALALDDDYLTELCPAAAALVASLADCLAQGAILMLDYGFSSCEYYHPQRHQGTLMCHYRHHAHSNPLLYVGLQDITAHVDFTQIAQMANLSGSGETSGISLAGYTTQAQFLMNCGILDLLAQVSPEDMASYAPLVAATQKLLSPSEMGELFKAICFTKNIDEALIGFANGDKAHRL